MPSWYTKEPYNRVASTHWESLKSLFGVLGYHVIDLDMSLDIQARNPCSIQEVIRNHITDMDVPIHIHIYITVHCNPLSRATT